MDRFTRNYSIVLGAIALIVIVWTFFESPAVSRLNGLLADNAELASYPYRFRVLSLEDGMATMSTPRSADFPVHRALGILFPELRNEAPDSPAVIAAQQEMARVQAIARETVAGSSDVQRIVWKLDETWLRKQGVDPGQL